jgi:GNAT superfamily N-acetyltransferase
MEEEYTIGSVDKAEDIPWGVVGGGLHDYNVQQAGDPHGKQVCFTLRAPGGEIAGGLIGEVHWDWFYINLLFVKDELRGRGYGHRLLALAEEQARQHGARRAYLDTFSFQAPDFYKEHGYQIFGELQDFPPGHRRFYFRKEL